MESLYHEAVEESRKVKAEHEVQILKASEDYARVVAQNEILTERNEVLFKLGKRYIENKVQPSNSVVSIDTNNTTDTDVIEVHKAAVETADTCAWTQNKLRGFKRQNISSNDNPDPTAAVTSFLIDLIRTSHLP